MEALIQDCKLFYQHFPSDKENAPAVLFLHGWGCDGSIFKTFMDDMMDRATVIAVDFPGHGQSGEPGEPWGVPEYAEQVRKLLVSLNISKVHIIAHSFGGRVALWLSSHDPEMVEKMVITGGAGLRKAASGNPSRKQQTYKRLKAIVNAMAKVPFLKSFCDGLQEKLVQKYGSPDYKRLNLNMRNTFVKVISQDLSDCLPKIQASTLLVWGANDTETPLWMGQQMEKEIADAGLVVFEGRSHFAFLEEAKRFLVIVNTFLFGGENA